MKKCETPIQRESVETDDVRCFKKPLEPDRTLLEHEFLPVCKR